MISPVFPARGRKIPILADSYQVIYSIPREGTEKFQGFVRRLRQLFVFPARGRKFLQIEERAHLLEAFPTRDDHSLIKLKESLDIEGQNIISI